MVDGLAIQSPLRPLLFEDCRNQLPSSLQKKVEDARLNHVLEASNGFLPAHVDLWWRRAMGGRASHVFHDLGCTGLTECLREEPRVSLELVDLVLAIPVASPRVGDDELGEGREAQPFIRPPFAGPSWRSIRSLHPARCFQQLDRRVLAAGPFYALVHAPRTKGEEACNNQQRPKKNS